MPISKIKTSSILADAASTNLNIDAGTLFLDATNNRVGVGTTSPGQNLHVASSSTGQTLVNIENTSAGGYSWNIGTIGSVAGLGPVGTFIIRDSTNGANRIAIGTSGSVGIGTSSPVSGRRLTVATTGTDSAIRIDAPTGYQSYLELTENASLTSGNYWQIGKIATTNALQFWNGAERMRITSAGNVGIGTTDPQDNLDVAGNARVGQGQVSSNATVGVLGIYSGMTFNTGNAQLKFFGKSVDNTGLTYELGRISSGSIGSAYTIGGGLIFSTASNNGANVMTLSPRMYITATGEVGIGDSSPSTKLSVGGSNTSLLSNQTSVYAPSANSAATSIKLFNDSATNGVYASLEFWVRNANNNINIAYIASPSISTNNSGTLTFGRRTADNTSVESMRITSNNELVVNGNLIVTGVTYTSGFYFTGGGTQTILTIGAGEAYLFYSVYASYGAGDHRHGVYYLAAASTQTSSGVQLSALGGSSGFSISAGVVSYSAGGGNPATTIWWQRLS
jgi:hypothetical protein